MIASHCTYEHGIDNNNKNTWIVYLLRKYDQQNIEIFVYLLYFGVLIINVHYSYKTLGYDELKLKLTFHCMIADKLINNRFKQK